MSAFFKALLDWFASLFRTVDEAPRLANTPHAKAVITVSNSVDDLVIALASKSKKQFEIAALIEFFKVYADTYGVNTKLRQAHFWAQAAHETGGFQWSEELGNQAYFTKYDNRLGNNEPGDGYKYRGRGIFQLTGKYNYTIYGNKLGLDLLNDPDQAESEEIAVLVALTYWKDRNCNEPADRDDIRGVTKKINGGFNGIASRIKYLDKAKKALGDLS